MHNIVKNIIGNKIISKILVVEISSVNCQDFILFLDFVRGSVILMLENFIVLFWNFEYLFELNLYIMAALVVMLIL